MTPPRAIYGPATANLARVGRLVAELTGSRYPSLTDGKRLRPALLLIAAGAWNDRTIPGAVELAAAIELVHLASLVHDDVIDSTVRRRSGPALHRLIGTKPAVIFADLLFIQGLARLESVRPARLVPEFIQAVRLMCEGQWLEVEAGVRLTEDRYNEIIAKKTAAIFAFAGRAGARLAGSASATARGRKSPIQNRKSEIANCRSLETFGREFGFVYQLLDDARDLRHRQLTPLERGLRRIGGADWCRERAAVHAGRARAVCRGLDDPVRRRGLELLLESALALD